MNCCALGGILGRNGGSRFCFLRISPYDDAYFGLNESPALTNRARRADDSITSRGGDSLGDGGVRRRVTRSCKHDEMDDKACINHFCLLKLINQRI